jgi:hypothetical protein
MAEDKTDDGLLTEAELATYGILPTASSTPSRRD